MSKMFRRMTLFLYMTDYAVFKRYFEKKVTEQHGILCSHVDGGKQCQLKANQVKYPLSWVTKRCTTGLKDFTSSFGFPVKKWPVSSTTKFCLNYWMFIRHYFSAKTLIFKNLSLVYIQRQQEICLITFPVPIDNVLFLPTPNHQQRFLSC